MSKVKFQVAKVGDYISSLIDLNMSNPKWKENLFSIYPPLRRKKTKKEITSFFERQEAKLLPVMNQVCEEFQASWDKINGPSLRLLEDIHEIKIPGDFTARITLNPVYPRYLDEKIFDLHFGMADRTMKTIALHEICHFFFYEKIRQLYPETEREEFETPHLLWYLSEFLPAVILTDKRFLRIFEPQGSSLIHENLRVKEVNGERVVNTLKEMYNRRKSFQDFFDSSYDFFKRHKREIVS